MKRNHLFPLVLLGATLISGCKTYNYQLAEPANLATLITDKPVTVAYDPLEYHLARRHDRLGMIIMNPTDDRITLDGRRSYVVDPKGESHPVRGRSIAPHSFIRMVLPPLPSTYPYSSFSSWWGPGFYSGFGYPYSPYWGFADSYYYGPVSSYYQVITPYDWNWGTGPARIGLSYARDGTTFEHRFLFVRQPAK